MGSHHYYIAHAIVMLILKDLEIEVDTMHEHRATITPENFDKLVFEVEQLLIKEDV